MLRLYISSLAVLLVSCVPPKRPPTYVAQVAYSIKEPAREHAVSAEAAAALEAAHTVAFYPPDDCAADACKRFVSSLERAAIREGFAVVPWQSLRGEKRPLAYARQHQVDLLFHVDALRFGVAASELVGRADTAFYAGDTGRSVAVRDAAAVARRCIVGTVPALQPDLAVAVEIKVSSVRDGHLLWTYRTMHSGLAPGRVINVDARYKSTSGYRLQGQSQWKIGVGIASVVVSITAALATLIIDGSAGGEVDFPFSLYAAEALLFGTGIYMLSTSNAKAHWGYSTPEQTLCVPARLVDGAPTVRTTVAPAVTCSGSCRQEHRIVARVVRELFAQIARLRKAAPR